MTDTQPNLTDANPFELVAYLLFKVRQSLEEPGMGGRPPRWVRIIRAREAKGEVIGGGVQKIVDGFANGISYMAELCLDLEELLLQTDAGAALLEVSLDLVRAATDPNFVNGVNLLVGVNADANPVAGVNVFLIDKVHREGTYIAVELSGKMRVLQWGFENALNVYGLGPKDAPESKNVPLTRLGVRWLWMEGALAKELPPRAEGAWSGGADAITLYEFLYDARESDAAKRTQDLEEVHTLLEALGYLDPSIDVALRRRFTPRLGKLLRQFQHINGLPKTGELDNATINRLLNLDFTAKNLRRAKPFDPSRVNDIDVPDVHAVRGGYLELVNPDADRPEDEGVTIVHRPPGYEYYVCGVDPPLVGKPVLPKGKGWINHAEGPTIRGFVALRSRRRIEGKSNADANFDGGIFSEGEAASGRFFFCARFVEPWVAGRTGEPGSDPRYKDLSPLFDGTKPSGGQRSGMYQWIRIEHLVSGKPVDSDLILSASALRRSLYTDRHKVTGVPDQGQVRLRVYSADFFKGYDTRFTLEAVPLGQVASQPFPQGEHATAAMTLSQVERSRVWTYQTTSELVVPQGAVAALISLEGIYQSGFDIDAYFDNVVVRWDYRRKAA